MPRSKSDGGGAPRPNRIRFIMLEADLSEGNLSELTNAITSALRPAAPMPRIAAPMSVAPALVVNSNGSEETVEIEEFAEEQADAPVTTARRTRRFYKPKVLKDVDLDAGDVSFADYVKKNKNPSETTKRYLLIAAWFHLYVHTNIITPDHVYTCYRSMDWVLDIKDVGQPFRDIKSQGWGDYKNRSFEINHVGLGQVKKMGTIEESA